MLKDSFSVLKKIYKHLRVKGKPLTIHTEMIVDNDVWEEIKKKVEDEEENDEVHTWYLMTPLNYPLLSCMFNLNLSLEEFSAKMKTRYLWLKKNKQRLQLHVHLCKRMKNINYDEQKLLINQSIKWFEDNLDQKVTEMVPGWWNYNTDTEQILKNLNIKLIKRFEYRDGHDYDWVSR